MAELEALAPELRLALAYTPVEHRPMLAALFGLDSMLSRFVARNTEPVLIQLRLAWWRDRLGEATGKNSSHDPLLADLRSSWAGDEAVLRQLVDAWEARLDETEQAGFDELVSARGATLEAFARRAGASGEASRAQAVGKLWARADLGTPDVEIDGDHLPQAKSLRGISVLGGVARRSLRTCTPMMGDRTSAILALRLGLFGR